MISRRKKSENGVGLEAGQRRLVTLAEAGEIIGGYSADPVRALMQKGLLPCVRVSRKRLVDLRDLESLIERSKETCWVVRPRDRRPRLQRFISERTVAGKSTAESSSAGAGSALPST